MRVLIVSPHFDDAPLSLGQSMLDGWLSQHDLTVGVVFSSSNYTRWFHPTRRRAPLATAIRRFEERVNSRRFHYRVITAGYEEAVLRLNSMSTESFLRPDYDAHDDPLLPAITTCIAEWARSFDAVLGPLGIGDHIDHHLAAAATHVASANHSLVGFYEDRPYCSYLSDQEITACVNQRHPGLVPTNRQTPIGRHLHHKLWYPSQFSEVFTTASRLDLGLTRAERVWANPNALEGWTS